jgi:branched-chain amino acid transport system permease protein
MSFQLIIFILLSSSIILLSVLSNAISFYSTKFFNFSQAAIISFAAYFTFLFFNNFHLPLYVAVFLSIFCCIVISTICELYIFRYMRIKNLSSLTSLIASIGLYTILQNLISLFFGDETKRILMNNAKVGHKIMGAFITDMQIVTISVSSGLFFLIMLLLYKTALGKQIRAVSNNPELSVIYGINSNRVILFATMVSSVIASILGILIALDVDMTPTFGFNFYLFGVVAMIIGGVGSYRGLIGGAVLLATVQQLSTLFLDTKWMDAVTYLILILFLIWKPLGFSGQRVRKVEI